MQDRALKGFAYDAADGSSSAKAPDGRAASEEQAARRGLRTIFDHVTRQGLPDLGQQGEVIDDIPLPLDDDLSRSPADVFEFEGSHLSRSEPETGQEKQDRVITPSPWSVQVAHIEQLLHVRSREIVRNAG
jgi:hypothetical protein